MLLSDRLGLAVRDARGQPIGRLRDIVVSVAGTEPPRVVGVVVRRKGADLFAPIGVIGGLDAQPVIVAAGSPDLAPLERRPREVLLARDVMDSQVISLRGPHVVRVNDAELTSEDGVWRLAGVDIGVGTLVRRLLPRALRTSPRASRRLPWADVELLSSDTPGGLVPPDHRRLARLHPADIARMADAMPARQATEIVASLDDERAADTMEEMVDAKQADVLDRLGPERAAEILDRMAPDAAADVLSELDPALVDDVLRRMDPAEAGDVHALLTYRHDTAGGLMSTDYVMAPRGLCVGDALAHLRPQLAKPDLVYYVYVVEDERERRLVGIFSLRDLLLADPEWRVDDIMVTRLRRVFPDTPAATVAQMMSEYNFLAVPVTDRAGRLLGVVSVDDALEVILPAALRRRVPRIFH